MKRILIVVADGARARFFRLEKVPRLRSGEALRLQELAGLVNPAGELTGLDLYSEARSGLNRAPHGASFGYDDHRAGHRREIERRFAREIVQATADFVRREAAEVLLLAVAPHLLGALRERLVIAVPAGVEIKEFAADLGWHTPAYIQRFLGHRGALPAASPSL